MHDHFSIPEMLKIKTTSFITTSLITVRKTVVFNSRKKNMAWFVYFTFLTAAQWYSSSSFLPETCGLGAVGTHTNCP